MKRIFFHCLVLAGLLASASVALSQQAPPPMSSQKLDFTTTLNGLPLHGQARGAEDLSYTSAISVSQYDGKTVLHRMIIDHNRHLYFGYDLMAYQVEGQMKVHLQFAPLTHVSSFGVDLSQYTAVGLKTPPEQTAQINTPVEVPLEQDGTGNTLLRDKLTFGPPAN